MAVPGLTAASAGMGRDGPMLGVWCGGPIGEMRDWVHAYFVRRQARAGFRGVGWEYWSRCKMPRWARCIGSSGQRYCWELGLDFVD
jgi:hypothetical protein